MLEAPGDETIWVTYYFDGKPAYAITSTKIRDFYYLCKVSKGKLVKTKHMAENPRDLERYIKRGDKYERKGSANN